MKNQINKLILVLFVLGAIAFRLKAQDVVAGISFIKGTPSADGSGYVTVSNNTFIAGDNDIYIHLQLINSGSPAVPATKVRPQLSIGGTGLTFDGTPVVYRTFNQEAGIAVAETNVPILNQTATNLRFENTNYAIPAFQSLDIFVKVIPTAAGNYTSALLNIFWNGPQTSGNLTGNDGAVSGNITIQSSNNICYRPGITSGTALDSKVGITSLGRAGDNQDNWPMVRKGAWLVLESKTKGFVMNRLTSAQIAAIPTSSLVEGMMVFDTNAQCLKVYTTNDSNVLGWYCMQTQTCPTDPTGNLTLNCGGATTTGNLYSGQVASGVSITVPYTGGDGSAYPAQTFSSTGVTGLTATLPAGTLNNGSGNVVLSITGTPSSSGTASFPITLAGQSCTVSMTVGGPQVGTVSALSCAAASFFPSTATQGLSYSGTFQLPYTGGNGGTYSAQSFTTNGLTFSLPAGNFNTGSGALTYSVTGIPTTPGTTSANVTIGGQTCPSAGALNVAPGSTMITVNCGGRTVGGSYIKGQAVTASNYVDIPVTAVGNPGAANITTNTANGLTFSSGNITITAGTTSVRLFAQGTPTNTDNGTLNTFTFTIPTNNGTCSFGVPVTSTVGSFANPAESCQKIFEEFNSSGTLIVNDGEYWIGTSTANRYKTRCDMVDAAEAASLDKQVGGYTLLMSYSERTAKTNSDFGTNGRFSWGSTALDNRNVVTTEAGTMNYNNFRITTAEKSRWNSKATRMTFTANPTNSNLALDTYLNYPVANTITGGETYYRSVGAGTVSGKYLGATASMVKNATGDRATLTIGGVIIENSNYFYNTAYNTHWNQTVYRYAPTLNGGNGAIISNWPLFVVGEYVSSLPFGYCINTVSRTPSPPEGGGYPSKTFTDACVPNNTNLDVHPGVNGTQGYVLQWWAK